MASESAGHSVCPTCGGHGLPRSVAIRDGQRTIAYECDVCRHRWEVTTPVATSRA